MPRNSSLAKQVCHPSKRKKRETPSLRKAPQAPKRFRSSYICFFTAKQPEIKKALGDAATVADVSRRSAYLWKMLSPEDRHFWDNMAAKDKQRYLAEKASYSGPWQIPYKRPKKDPSAPKRPASAFLHFTRGRRSRIKEENPGMKNTEVSKILGNLWRKSTTEERRPYLEKEKVEREKYKIAMSEWKCNKRQKEKSQVSEQEYGQHRSQLECYQPSSYYHRQQQDIQVQNKYPLDDTITHHRQQTNQYYSYSDFQPPITRGVAPRKVSNSTDFSFDLRSDTIEGNFVTLNQNFVAHDDRQLQNCQQPPQPNVYSCNSLFGDDGRNDDREFTSCGNLLVVDSCLT